MTHSAGPRSPCAGGRPDCNGTQGAGMPGIAGVLRLAALMKTVKGESARPDDLRYKWEYRIIKGSGGSRGTGRSTGTAARSVGEVGVKSEPWVSPTGCVWKHDTLCRPTLALRRRSPGLDGM